MKSFMKAKWLRFQNQKGPLVVTWGSWLKKKKKLAKNWHTKFRQKKIWQTKKIKKSWLKTGKSKNVRKRKKKKTGKLRLKKKTGKKLANRGKIKNLPENPLCQIWPDKKLPKKRSHCPKKLAKQKIKKKLAKNWRAKIMRKK